MIFTTKKIIIVVVIIAIIAVGTTLGVIFIGGDDDDGSTTKTTRTIQIPASFKIGTATASYQIEGGWNAHGKGPNIWDTFTHTYPERIADGSNGDVAANSYEKYQEDVDALASIGSQFYRFSISWSRVLPTGDISSRNEAGIQYYHKLIDALLEKNIEPMATMYHWDLPQYIQDLGGWMNPLIVDYLEEYANLLFSEYGDKIKSWITFNEPLEYCGNGYGTGTWPPALRLPGVGEYYCAHHTVLAHARIYHLYEDSYFATQQGQVGITLSTGFAFPEKENDPEHLAASDRAMQWSIGIYAHPIFTKTGNYPQVIRDRVDQNSADQGFAWSRLPKFSDEEVEYIRGTSDFLGLNYYTSSIVIPANDDNDWPKPSKWHDTYIYSWQDPSWPRAKSAWLASIPNGLYRTLTWIRDNYQNVETIITENGWSDDGEMQDVDRINYLELHFEAVVKAINDGCHVTGHTSWSLIDNFEWLLGYTEKFGIIRVDVEDPELKRVEKDSSTWLRNVIKNRQYTIDED
jgi:beta-glucosidase/6-phospho-beta-glucosidase/beta-galactosidase